MTLTEQQISTLREMASQGAQLNDIQKHIQSEFGISITYMDTRFLVSDHHIEILSPEALAPKEETPIAETTLEPAPAPEEVGVKVSVDQVTRPGAMVNGTVQWSDGVTSIWYLDQIGQLGLDSPDPQYQPIPSDIEDFQIKLRQVLGA